MITVVDFYFVLIPHMQLSPFVAQYLAALVTNKIFNNKTAVVKHAALLFLALITFIPHTRFYFEIRGSRTALVSDIWHGHKKSNPIYLTWESSVVW